MTRFFHALRARLNSRLNGFPPLRIYVIGYVDAVLTLGIVAAVIATVKGAL